MFRALDVATSLATTLTRAAAGLNVGRVGKRPEKPGDPMPKTSRVVVVGDGSFIANQGRRLGANRNLFLNTVGWLSANVDEWSGSFTYLHARAHYAFTHRWGASLGYQFTDVDVERDQGRRETAFDMQFTGPTLQVTWLF